METLAGQPGGLKRLAVLKLSFGVATLAVGALTVSRLAVLELWQISCNKLQLAGWQVDLTSLEWLAVLKLSLSVGT